MASRRKIVRVELERISPYDFEGSLDTIIESIEFLKREYSEQYSDVKLGLDHPDYSDSFDYVVYGSRLESDVEYTKRLQREQKAKKVADSRLAKKLEAAEKLLKKHGKKN